MTRPFSFQPITCSELISMELKREAQKQRGNSSLETYRVTVDREDPGEVVYVGDERIAVVAWKGNVYRREHVDSSSDAFSQVLHEVGG